MRLSIIGLCAALSIPFAAAYSAPSSTTAPLAAAGHMRQGLTPEEHFLYKKQLRGPGSRKLSIAQRCERARTLRQQRRAMTPAQRQKLKQQLDAEWSRLPAAEKQRIEQRIAKHQERHAEGKPRVHAKRCADVNPAEE
jgi:hypothetical protein